MNSLFEKKFLIVIYIYQNKFSNNTTTILDNHWQSCGANIFLLWKKRIVYKHSFIMFHNVSWWAGWKLWNVKSSIDFKESYYNNLNRDIYKWFFTKKEIDKIFIWQDYYFNTTEMCERWMSTHVIIDWVEMTSKEFLKLKK